MSDFIIREASSENARGPFTLEELKTLFEAGQVTPETLYYVESSETWQPLESNPIVKESIFPDKNKLSLRKRKSRDELEKERKELEKAETIKRKKEGRRVPTVEELLAETDAELAELERPQSSSANSGTAAAAVVTGASAMVTGPQTAHPEATSETSERQTVYSDRKAADIDRILAESEGQTQDTAYLARRRRSKELAYSMSSPVLAFALLLLAFSFIYPVFPQLRDAVRDAQPQFIIEQPTVILAVIDLILAIAVGLAATEVYPILRVRAIIAMGFFGIIFYSFGNWPLLGASIATGLGLYVLTLSARFWLSLIASVLALGGAAVFALAGYYRVLNIG